MAALAATLIIASLLTPQPKPLAQISGRGYQINYYNAVGTPVLTVRGYVDSRPVPLIVSLFAYTPTSIYPAGYYRGYGAATARLTATPIEEAARAWGAGGRGEPSLLAFVTYVDNSTGTMRFVALAIPYRPGWVELGRVSIVAVVNLTGARPLPLNPSPTAPSPSINRPLNPTGSDPYGYSYVGSCMGSGGVVANPPGVPGAWQLESCYEFEGPIPLAFIAWSKNTWNSGVSQIGIVMTGGSYAEAGSGFYASYSVYNVSGDYVVSVASSGPTWSFPQQANMEIESWPWLDCGVLGGVYVHHGSSISISCPASYLYSVPGSGALFLAARGYVAAPTFYSCVFQPGPSGEECEPVYVANGTMVLDITSYTPGYLHLYPYIDLGNGTVTKTLSLLRGEGLAGRAFTVLDAQSYYYNPAINQVVEVPECGDAPSPSSISPSVVAYNLQGALTTYKPGVPGWAVDVGGVLADLMAGMAGAPGVVGPFLGFAASYLLNHLGSSSSTVYQDYVMQVGAGSSSVWGFYVSFVGTPALEASSGSEYSWPMGVVINGSNYYLYYLLGRQCWS
ncbi:hypothetical protein GCM10007981_05660 [Thermocladium modestius]|uniref:Uncharacterized protein n=1 Tax=Thermocladium modestius TaxID=62609 RepID=A0A830GTJ1_9CREN|nr:hypothetical protein GCM10007981_05660 [Thermocladium modestius]